MKPILCRIFGHKFTQGIRTGDGFIIYCDRCGFKVPFCFDTKGNING